MQDLIMPMQREKTVFLHKVSVRLENLTKDGYFNLNKIPQLRILDNGFLKKIRKEYQKTQQDLARMIKTPLRTIIGWESYKKALPFSKLIEVCNKLNINKRKMHQLVYGCEFTFGEHHGKNRIKLPLKPEDFKMANYLIPITPDKVYAIKNTPKEIKDVIIKDFSIDKYYLNKTRLLVIYSYLLYHFLKTFYIYKKDLILKFPLSKEVPFWVSKNVNLSKAVIIPLLITDGGEKISSVFCSGESNIIHDIWADACYYEFNKLPSSYKVPYKSIFITTHRFNQDILNSLKSNCPIFKTSPSKESAEEYLKLKQPTISYLLYRSRLEQQIAIRLWAITEGSISIHNSKREKLITPNLRIACAHPKLTNELKEIVKSIGINMSIKKGYNNWSGVGGLQTTSIKSIINFLKIGGFIRGVKVAKSKSKFFGGFDKQDVLLGILEFMKRQRENKSYRTSNIQKINKWIKNIIRNKEFKNELYYTNYFQKKC
ncbi:MAG: helix-turn-helix transcriptional regulator [Nanoarchaeota archaeon]